MSPLLAAVSYNARAISVLGYISQLTPPPPSIAVTERSLLHHLLHLPTNSFEHRTFFHISQLGCKDFVGVQAFCDASLARTAIKTIRDWQSQYDWLAREAKERLSLREVNEGKMCSQWWDSQPFVYHLHSVPSVTPTKKLTPT